MSQSVRERSSSDGDRAAGTAESAPDSAALDDVLRVERPLTLHHGETLERVRIAYRLAGSPRAPVVAVLGGISAHRHVTADHPRGWWKEIAGPGQGVNTEHFAVLGLDFIGGSGDSTSPGEGAAFPALDARDQADALWKVLDVLGVDSLHAIVGASYGGMVAMAFAQRYPQRVQRIVVVSAADRAHPMSTAWRSVQRQIVREALSRGDGAGGLRLARALAMTTYRSPAEFAARFAAAPQRRADKFCFPVEDYLFARGDHYVQQYRAESFLALSESIDLFRIDPAGISTPATLVAVREDQLVPLADVRRLAAQLAGKYRLIELDSIYGHDAFLKEAAVVNPIISAALTQEMT